MALVKEARIEAAMVYACCHNGNCLYPTQVGYMHSNLSDSRYAWLPIQWKDGKIEIHWLDEWDLSFFS